MKVYFVKRDNCLCASDEIGEEVLQRIPNGVLLLCGLTAPRNPPFHDRFMKMLRAGFKYWEPGELGEGYGTPEKRFENFRKDVIIMAGFFNLVFNKDGSYRIDPASISFDNMENVEFSEVYHRALDVLVKNIFPDLPQDEAKKRIEEEILSFS